MADATCQQGGHATTDRLKRGMCGNHYRGWWEANRAAKCDVEGCEGGQVGRGWCRPHYRHWHRYGHPTIKPAKPPRPKATRPPCTHPDGCTEPQRAKDLCHRHYSARWYAQNTERAKATQAANRARNRARDRARVRAWRMANPDRAASGRRHWYAANRAAVREYRRGYRQRNREAIRLLNAGRRARQRNAPMNDFTAREWRAIKAAYGQRCAYCHRRRKLTIDHVVPLSRGGSHTASNIVPACGPCNSTKNAGPAPTYQPLLV